MTQQVPAGMTVEGVTAAQITALQGRCTTLEALELTGMTAVASTSGVAIDFTGIPATAKRITILFNGMGTSGTSNLQVQVGSGSVVNTGYASQAWAGTTGGGVVTTGLVLTTSTASGNHWDGVLTLNLLGSNTWIAAGKMVYNNATSVGVSCAGNTPGLSGALDRVRITTVNGTDTFNFGAVNILYE